jgi:hypothetical protein
MERCCEMSGRRSHAHYCALWRFCGTLRVALSHSRTRRQPNDAAVRCCRNTAHWPPPPNRRTRPPRASIRLFPNGPRTDHPKFFGPRRPVQCWSTQACHFRCDVCWHGTRDDEGPPRHVRLQVCKKNKSACHIVTDTDGPSVVAVFDATRSHFYHGLAKTRTKKGAPATPCFTVATTPRYVAYLPSKESLEDSNPFLEAHLFFFCLPDIQRQQHFNFFHGSCLGFDECFQHVAQSHIIFCDF